MAKATATCRCATCGKQFVVSKDCFSRSDADGWSAWASEHMTECPDCRRLRVKFDAAAKAAPIVWECELPEITGASDKQIAYARDLRSRYLAEKGDLVPSYAKQRRFEGSDRMLANLHVQAQRKGSKAMLAEYRTHMMRYEYLPVLFCTGDARQIIDCLKNKY